MKARNKMNAIEIDSWISTLRVDALTTHQIDEKSTELLHRLFEITEQIEPCGDDDMKVFRIHCERGTLEEYRDKFYEPEEDVDLEELKESFLKEYPEETVWYRFASKHFYREWNDTTFYGVFLNDEYILADGDVNAKGWPYDASELLLFLCDAAEQVVRELEDGSYHKIIEKELPYRYRYGKIRRKDYPVMMYRGREIAERLMETDMIGIAPEYVNPFFLDGEIQLCDSGDPEAVIAKAEWDPEKPVRIKKNM